MGSKTCSSKDASLNSQGTLLSSTFLTKLAIELNYFWNLRNSIRRPDHVMNSAGNVKNGESEEYFSGDEKDLIKRLYNLLGDRWALIAGRLPGRTAEEIEKYWKRRSSDE